MACLCPCLVHHPVFFWLIVRPKCKRLRTCPFESPSCWCDQGCIMCGNSSPVVSGLTLVLARDLEKRMLKRCPSDLEQRYTPSVVGLKACFNSKAKKKAKQGWGNYTALLDITYDSKLSIHIAINREAASSLPTHRRMLWSGLWRQDRVVGSVLCTFLEVTEGEYHVNRWPLRAEATLWLKIL